MVSARRRGNELRLVPLDDEARPRALALAERLLALAREHVGRTREDLAASFGAIDVGPRDHRLRAALAKLVEDRCRFDELDDVDPEALRRDVFGRASAARAELEPPARFDRTAVL